MGKKLTVATVVFLVMVAITKEGCMMHVDLYVPSQYISAPLKICSLYGFDC